MLAVARARVESGDAEQVWDHDHKLFVPAAAALREVLETRPTPVGPVVIHGDYCLPNVLVGPAGPTGLLDVGACGRGDPWVDLTACEYSGRRNLKAAWDGERFLELYGVRGDPSRLRWFRLLSDLQPIP